jgi:hypothetical protein
VNFKRSNCIAFTQSVIISGSFFFVHTDLYDGVIKLTNQQRALKVKKINLGYGGPQLILLQAPQSGIPCLKYLFHSSQQELHAHLNGSIRDATLSQIYQEKFGTPIELPVTRSLEEYVLSLYLKAFLTSRPCLFFSKPR